MKHASIISILLSIAILSGCTAQAIQATYDKQETNIENLVQSILKTNEDATVEYLDGVVRISFAGNATPGETVEAKSSVSFYYGGYTITGQSLSSSNLFATNSRELAQSAGWTNLDESNFEPETVQLGKGDLVPGLETGLVGTHVGDECMILFSGKYGWGNHSRGTVPARSALAFHVLITDVSND